MMKEQPILTLDTSAINRLADDPDSQPLMEGLRSGYFVRLTFLSIEEVVATTVGNRRHQLFGVCKRLLSSGDCIDPPDELLEKLIASFEESAPFNWQDVDVSFPEAQQTMARLENVSDELSEVVRAGAQSKARTFDQLYANAKPNFDKVLNDDNRPESVCELVHGFRSGGQYWKMARNIYERVAEHSIDETTIRRFDMECPPFHALMVALCAAHYDRNAKPKVGPLAIVQSLRAGWVDTFMAVCLPYCNLFITNDHGQSACYREVASLSDLDVQVHSYEEFRSSVCLT